MTITTESVSEVMAAWNEFRVEAMEEENVVMGLLPVSVWMDRLFHAHMREALPKPKQTRKTVTPKDLTPNGGPQAVD